MAKKLSDDAAEKKPNISADTFLEHFRTIRREKVKVDEAVADYRSARKRAKSAGISMAALSLLETLSKLEPEEAALRLKQLGFYAQAAGLEWGSQMDLFGHYDDAKPSEKSAHQQKLFQAEEDGRYAGAGGESETLNKFDPGTELFVAWNNGYRNGKQFFDRRKEADGGETRKPRGRKAKSGNPEDRPAA